MRSGAAPRGLPGRRPEGHGYVTEAGRYCASTGGTYAVTQTGDRRRREHLHAARRHRRRRVGLLPRHRSRMLRRRPQRGPAGGSRPPGAGGGDAGGAGTGGGLVRLRRAEELSPQRRRVLYTFGEATIRSPRGVRPRRPVTSRHHCSRCGCSSAPARRGPRHQTPAMYQWPRRSPPNTHPTRSCGRSPSRVSTHLRYAPAVGRLGTTTSATACSSATRVTGRRSSSAED